VFQPLTGFAQKVFEIALAKRKIPTQRRKDAKKTVETRQRFAPLRLCVRNLRRLKDFLCKAP
jgi:hypothetical protein